MTVNLRRSALYVPGDSEKMLRRSAVVPSDMLLLNLEDGVALSKKGMARDNIANALQNIDFGNHEIVVRINPLGTGIGMKDLATMVPLHPQGICLPKVEEAAEVRAADEAILKLELSHGISQGSIKLHAMIESARGLLRSPEIASASPRMASMIFGSADYANDVRCQPGEDRVEVLFALLAAEVICLSRVLRGQAGRFGFVLRDGHPAYYILGESVGCKVVAGATGFYVLR